MDTQTVVIGVAVFLIAYYFLKGNTKEEEKEPAFGCKLTAETQLYNYYNQDGTVDPQKGCGGDYVDRIVDEEHDLHVYGWTAKDGPIGDIIYEKPKRH